jgi:hypothetical protein
LWGFVTDETGRGIPGVRVRGIYADGGVNETHATKGPPDTAIGRYDFSAGGGTWTLQLVDLGGSPAYRIQAHQPYTGSGNCPTRVDFVKQ